MRTPSTRRIALALPLLLSFASTGGCAKLEELKNKVAGEAEAKAEVAEGVAEAAVAAAGVVGEPAPIPVEPPATSLDLLLSFIPDPSADFVVVRDASVFIEYFEEFQRVLEPSLAKLEGPLPEPSKQYAEWKPKADEVLAAIKDAGVHLQHGLAVSSGPNGKGVLVLSADDPAALAKVAAALGEDDIDADECKAIEGHAGWVVCAEELAGFKPNDDTAALRKTLAQAVPGVDLDEANVLFSFKQGEQPVSGTIVTLPGLVHAAITLPPDDDDAKEVFAALEPGEAATLGSVQPGAGFVWARTKPELAAAQVAEALAGAPEDAKRMLGSLRGEWLLTGSVEPGGLVTQFGFDDVSPWPKLLDQALAFKALAPESIPDIEGSKLTIEKVALEHEGVKADALHIGVSGIEEAGVLKAFTGLHLDAWAFAAHRALTIAVGPSPENVAKLLAHTEDGPKPDTLASLPAPLAKALTEKTTSVVIHLPLDFHHGPHLQQLVTAALKDVPDVKAEEVQAAISLLAPFSSMSAWFEHHGDGLPVIHLTVLGIGNTKTEEGKEALAAARAVVEGTSPADAFGPLVSKYPGSPMAFAYATRAGTEGLGSLIGSGIGAAYAISAIVYPVATGHRNATIAEELHVKPEDPAPEVEIKTKPVAPKHKTTPKPDVKPVEPPKPDVKPVEPPKPDADGSKPDGIIVEPPKPEDTKTLPKPPVPKPSIDQKPEDKAKPESETKPADEPKPEDKTKPLPKPKPTTVDNVEDAKKLIRKKIKGAPTP